MTDVITDPVNTEPMAVPDWVNREGLETMLVHITDEHIALGDRGEQDSCMIAQAFDREVYVIPGCDEPDCSTQDTSICGHPGYIHFIGETWRFSSEVCLLVQAWDRGSDVQPFSFLAWRTPE